MHIGVVGAGIIGVSVAVALAVRGHKVAVYDRAGIASGASGGNAGAFAFADVIPLATPGIMRKAPGWLLDPNGPLTIPPAYALQIAPWLLRFWRASLPDRYRAAVAAQGALMRLSSDALDLMVARHGLSGLIRREGQLQLYEGERQFRASLRGWEERRAVGVAFSCLEGPGAIAEIQPGIAPGFTHAVFTPNWQNVADPAVWTRRLADEARRAGAGFEQAEIRAIRPQADGVFIEANGASVRFDRVVLAAGAHSGALLTPLGLRLPLETERGYNVTLPSGAFDLRTHVTFSNHGFVVSRVEDGIRIGGGVELGGLNLPPNMSRADALLAKARRFLSALHAEEGVRWMGFRPSMPDSLPVIGPAPDHPRLVLAFGHGHLGLTQSAGTAQLVADLIEGRPPAISLAPYSASRF